MKKDLFIGLMSGTSIDGVDSALVQIKNKKIKLLCSYFQKFNKKIKNKLLSLNQLSSDEINHSQLVQNELTILYSEAIDKLLKKSKSSRDSIEAIGCHGQTIRHRPDLGYSIQLVNGSLLTELSKITTVCDFRSKDIANKGEGAPLVPVFHKELFFNKKINRIILNIGGISNITYIGKNSELFGFDSGPGNMLLDYWVSQKKNKPYDINGRWASSGCIDYESLQKMLNCSFFVKRPPKSTGRELFNQFWLKKVLRKNLKDVDVQATLSELTAVTISDAIKKYCPRTDEIYVCGGGCKNNFLMKNLGKKLGGLELKNTKVLGLNPDFVEATAFAWLAHICLKRKKLDYTSITGSNKKSILGCVYFYD